MLFKHFASKTQLLGFYIRGILVENGLSTTTETYNFFSWLNRTTESVLQKKTFWYLSMELLHEILTWLRVFQEYFYQARYISVCKRENISKRTSPEISMSCFQRNQVFNHVNDISVFLHVSPKAGRKRQSFLKRSYSCDASIFVLIAFDV